MKKNLRKVLALVLVLVTVFALGTIGASAAFTDTSSTKYSEAISVLSGIGVLNGTTSTTFDPTGSLTREAAAKIITYLQLGPTKAALITAATGSMFKDVAADRWSAGYIEYCANQNIITGDGTGNFNPTGTLTTAAFTKMLLCALGYKADQEGLTGAAWANNTATLAVNAGVYDSSITISGTTVCTREQAAQLALKTLKAICVEYTGGTTITIGGTSITTGATRSKVENALTNYITVDGYMQFGEKYFTSPLLKITSAFVGGRNGYYWYSGTTAVSAFCSSDVVLATRSTGTATATLRDASSAFYIGYAADSSVSYRINDYSISAIDGDLDADANYTTGQYVLVGTLAAGSLYHITSDIDTTAADPADNIDTNATLVGAYAVDAKVGVTVNFIDTDYDSLYDVISFTQKSAEMLAAAPTVTTSGALTYVTVGTLGQQLSTDITYPSDLAKYDVITWYKAGTHYYVEKATSITGSVASYNSYSVTINGTSYRVAAMANKTLGDLQTAIGVTGYTYYLDSNNNIVYATAPSGAATLTNTYLVTATDAVSSFGVYTYKAAVVAADGTQSTITVKKTASDGGTMTAISTANANQDDPAGTAVVDGRLVAGTYYTYVKNSDGTYNLTEAANQVYAPTDLTQGVDPAALDDDDTSYTVTGSTANFLNQVTYDTTWAHATAQNIYATSSTVFLVFNSTTYTYTAYTGITSAPSISAGGTVYVLKDSTNVYASVVVIVGGTASSVTSSYDKIFVTSFATTTLDSNSTPLFTYTAVVNGVAGKSITSYAAMDAGKVYYTNDYSSAGYINTVATTLSGATQYTTLKDIAYSGGVMNIDAASDAAYILNSNAVIYLYDTSAFTVTQLTADAAAAYAYANAVSDYVTVIQTSSTDTTISYVYITVA